MSAFGGRADIRPTCAEFAKLFWEARMRGGRLRTGLRIAVSTTIGLSLALTANYLALAQPQPGQTSPARDRDSAPPYPLEGEAVSKPPAAPPTAHAVACSESL